MGDHVRADSIVDFTGKVIESSDPQIHGMDAKEQRTPRIKPCIAVA